MSQQSDLFKAFFTQFTHIFYDSIHRTANFTAPHMRYDTVGTELITSIHNRYPCKECTIRFRRQFRQYCIVHVYIDLTLFRTLYFFDHFVDMLDIMRTQYDINMRSPLKHIRLVFLCHTASNSND